MILTRIGPLTAYRMHTPKWAVAPTSGAGAAVHGGRVNRPGTPALYLSLEFETAVQEYQQLSQLMSPGTLVSYNVEIEPVVDFRGGFLADTWDPVWEDFYADWRALWFNRHIEPPSWLAVDQAAAAGAKGVVFRSALVAGGTNLVVYNDAIVAGDRIEVVDPGRALPRDQSSWA